MAEHKNNFIKSKMNKDLDSRLIPPGEYRDAKNVMISTSEGDDVGALENILKNENITSLFPPRRRAMQRITASFLTSSLTFGSEMTLHTTLTVPIDYSWF